MCFKGGTLLAAFLAAGIAIARAQPSMSISSSPLGVLYGKSIYVTVKPLSKEAFKKISVCRVHFSDHTAGNQVAGHDITISQVTVGKASPKISVEFSTAETGPEGNPKIGIGMYYYVVSCGENQDKADYYTPEFPLRIEANQKPALITPEAVTSSYTPTISWQAVTNVPAYHVLVSDQVVQFDEETYSVHNVSIIWQAITTKTSIIYGTPDPSGNYLIPAPPLSPNINYTLIIFNNYDGRNLSATSDKAKDFRIFKIGDANPEDLKPPRNLSPASGDTLYASDHPEIRFSWTDSGASANTYKLYIYSKEQYVGFQEPILIPVWYSETTDTSLVFNASGTLTNRYYTYKVFANSTRGKSLAGDTTSFLFVADEREVSFYTRTRLQMASKLDTVPVGNVNIEIRSLERSFDPLPLVTDASGWTSRKIPMGRFELYYERPGYTPLQRTLEINEQSDSAVFFTVFLEPYSAIVSGQVLNARGIPVFDASITATNNFQEVLSAKSDANGRFLLGLFPGQYRLQVGHPDFKRGVDTIFTLQAQEHMTLQAMLLENLTTFLTGDVTSHEGAPLSGALLQALDAEGREIQRALSDYQGRFTMPLAKGSYKLAVSKTGFGSLTKNFLLMNSLNLSLVLQAGASLITGRVYGLSNSMLGHQTAPLDNALLTLAGENSADTQITRTDEMGNYHFSVSGPGSYFLRASYPGRADSAMDTLAVTDGRTTLEKNFTLNQFAEIRGEVRLNPFTQLKAEDINVFLRDSTGNAVIQSVIPSMADTTYPFVFRHVPNGKYALSAGTKGYGWDSLLITAIENLAWQTDIVIPLEKSSKKMRFNLVHRDFSIPGKINFKAPITALLDSRDTLKEAPFGKYLFSVIPDSAHMIPRENFPMTLERQGPEDTALTFHFPFIHVPQAKFPAQGAPAFTFQNFSDSVVIDSAFLIFRYRDAWDTARYQPPFQEDNGLKVESLRPGGPLAYYFDIYSSEGRFSNSAPSTHFSVNLPSRQGLAYLQLDKTDTINLGLEVPLTIQVSGFDHQGNNLDSAIDRQGQISWKTSASAALLLDSAETRRARIIAKERIQGIASIEVRVTYQGTSLSAIVYARIVEGSINKLQLSSTMGNEIFITPFTHVHFNVTGLDTTFSPPLKIEASPELNLVPPSAGGVVNRKLILNSNFIGPLRVTAVHREKERIVKTELGIDRYAFLRGLNVGQVLKPGDTGRVLIHNPQFELIVPDSALDQETQGLLVMNKRTISGQYTNNRKITLKGELYEMSNPLKTKFAKKPVLKIGLPEGASLKTSRLGIFSDSALKWLPIPVKAAKSGLNTFGNKALVTHMSYLDGFYYGILIDSKPLSVSDFSIIPNPFSPMVMAERDGNTKYGTRIRFTPHSNKSDRVSLTLKIFNLRGELVRTLEPLRSMPKETLEYYWDGKTDSGLWARNGRYLILLLVRETVDDGYVKYIKPVVLYK